MNVFILYLDIERVNVDSTMTLCSTGNTANATLHVVGGSPPYEYSV